MRTVLNHSLQTQVLSPKKIWRGVSAKKKRKQANDLDGRIAKNYREVDYSIFTPETYLFTWSTIVAGVESEKDGHTIVYPHGKWVNANGNSWLNDVLLESYHSFILAENYLEHVQVPTLSKGKVLDAVAWVVQKQLNGYKEPVPTIFVDILVATNKKKHPKLCDRILSGNLKTLSMGCNLSHSQCSQCGQVFREGEDDFCKHIKNNLGGTYVDMRGRKRRTSELCGVPQKKNSCVFIEASWVKEPAFTPALRHGFVEYSQKSGGGKLRSLVPNKRFQEAAEEV